MQTHEQDSWLFEPPPTPTPPPAAPPLSKSWLLALDDKRAGDAGWKPVVPGAPAPRNVRLPSASNAEYMQRHGRLRALKRPLLWSFVAVVATGILAAAWQLVRAHARPVSTPTPAETPAPAVVPLPAEEPLETGSRIGPDCPTPGLDELVREQARSELLAVRERSFGAEAGALALLFPRVTNVFASASSARGTAQANTVEAAAPRVRIVGREHIAGVWQGATVPLEALGGKSKWLTPSVGHVQLELVDGSSLEGRLHALGEGRLWIETGAGRVSFPGSEVRTLRQLSEAPPTQPGTGTAALRDVVVRTHGGVFRGKLLRKEEGRMTLLLAEGGQITLEGGVELAEAAPARIQAP